jgi:catechol 2,3-dioxygenase-like lactoylglutathione lyase family enzyme
LSTKFNHDETKSGPSRRSLLAASAGIAALPVIATAARAAGDDAKPAAGGNDIASNVLGLDHISIIVPDVEKVAKFYASVFNANVYKEKGEPTRYYVPLDPGYLSFGTRVGQSETVIDYTAALVKDYDADAVEKRLEKAGITANRGVFRDPDDLGFRLVGTPGGLPSTVETVALADEPALFRTRGLSHIASNVASLEKSDGFYKTFFGAGKVRPSKAVGYTGAGPSRWLLLPPRQGRDVKPHIDHYGVWVAPFDAEKVAKAIEDLGGKVTSNRGNVFIFRGPDEVAVEIRTVDPTRLWQFNDIG